MMTDLYQFTEEPGMLILGIGEDSKKYIEEIREGYSSSLSAKMLDGDFFGPKPGIQESENQKNRILVALVYEFET